MLSSVLDQIDGAEDPDGADIEIDRHWVGAYPEGALVLLVVDAEPFDVAEHDARDIMLQVLEHTELLADWQITTCEIGFDERFTEADLHAADGPDTPPADLHERARWLTHQPDHDQPDATTGDVDWHAWLLTLDGQRGGYRS
jgi:hypothetical protein